jgi:hypothetical protein
LVPSATTNPANKEKGREPNAPLTEGTAKRPCKKMRRAAPDWALTQRGPCMEKFAVFR